MDQMLQLITFAVLVLGGFYFILLRPVLQQQRRQRRDLASLQPGDEVLLTSGLIATVVDLQIGVDDVAIMTLEFGSGVRVRALPSAIAQRWNPSVAEADTPTEGEQQPEGGA
jgi:preprotein translocase subunit YajC